MRLDCRRRCLALLVGRPHEPCPSAVAWHAQQGLGLGLLVRLVRSIHPMSPTPPAEAAR